MATLITFSLQVSEKPSKAINKFLPHFVRRAFCLQSDDDTLPSLDRQLF